MNLKINGLDEIDNQILSLLKVNARFSYSEIAKRVGLTHPAVKARIENLEDLGIIRGYEVKLAPKKIDHSVEFMLTIAPRTEYFEFVIGKLAACDMVHKIQASTGEVKVYASGVAKDMEAIEQLNNELRKSYGDVRYMYFDIIVSTYKDVDGGIEYEKPKDES